MKFPILLIVFLLGTILSTSVRSETLSPELEALSSRLIELERLHLVRLEVQAEIKRFRQEDTLFGMRERCKKEIIATGVMPSEATQLEWREQLEKYQKELEKIKDKPELKSRSPWEGLAVSAAAIEGRLEAVQLLKKGMNENVRSELAKAKKEDDEKWSARHKELMSRAAELDRLLEYDDPENTKWQALLLQGIRCEKVSVDYYPSKGVSFDVFRNEIKVGSVNIGFQAGNTKGPDAGEDMKLITDNLLNVTHGEVGFLLYKSDDIPTSAEAEFRSLLDPKFVAEFYATVRRRLTDER